MSYRPLTLVLALLLSFIGGRASAQSSTLETLKSMNSAGQGAVNATHPGDARWGSGQGFDRMSDGNYLSTPLVPIPAGYESSTRTALGNLVVGREGTRISEPKSPLTPDGKAKPTGSGNRVWWTIGGVAAGAGLGFLIGGPIGAAIGAAVGGVLGFLFGK